MYIRNLYLLIFFKYGQLTAILYGCFF